MIAALMLYAAVIGLLLAVVGVSADHAAALRGSTRRWLWAGVLAASVTLPLIGPWRAAPYDIRALLPFFDGSGGAVLPGPPRWAEFSEGLRSGLNATVTATTSLDGLLLAIWLAASSAATAVCLTGYFLMRRRRRGWREEVINDHRVLIAPDTGPAVVGLIAPRIVLPEWALQLDKVSVSLILSHEHEHVRSGDPWVIHFSTAAVLIMPWNPFVWWMASRIRLAVELDCDVRVLAGQGARHENAEVYGELLLTVAARRTSHSPLVLPALIESSSTLTRRISAMFPAAFRFATARAASAFIVAVTLVFTAVAIPAPRAIAQAPARDADQGTPPSTASSERPFGEGAYRIGAQPQFRGPVVIHRVKPRYTREAMHDKIAGQVILEAVVEPDGTVGDTRITKSLEPGLDREALIAARQWLFMPGTLGDVAVPTIVDLVMEFTLR